MIEKDGKEHGKVTNLCIFFPAAYLFSRIFLSDYSLTLKKTLFIIDNSSIFQLMFSRYRPTKKRERKKRLKEKRDREKKTDREKQTETEKKQ